MMRKKLKGLLPEEADLVRTRAKVEPGPDEDDAASPAEHTAGEAVPEKPRRTRKPRKTADPQQEISAFCDAVFMATDLELQNTGLSPLTEAQKTLIRMGIVGCTVKYGIGIGDYPEIFLVGGIAWATAEKVQEYHRTQANKSESS